MHVFICQEELNDHFECWGWIGSTKLKFMIVGQAWALLLLWQRPVYGPYHCQLYPYWTYGVLLIPLVTCEGAHFLRTVSQQMGKCVRCSGIFRQYVIQGRRKIHFYMDSLTVYFKIVWKYYLYKNFKI